MMRVFVSHGLDKKDAAELAFLDALDAALRAPTPKGTTHEILVDRSRLEAGDDWEGVLLDLLEECDRALLLLTTRALARPWVAREATILDARARRGGAYRLYPLACGVGRADIDAQPMLKSLKLDRLQFFDAAATAMAIAAKVHADLDAEPQPGENALVRVAEAIAAQLGAADLGQLRRLCDEVAAPLAFDAGNDERRRCALGLARAIVGRRLGACKGFAGMIRRLGNECAVANEALDRIRELAAPLWVPAEAAHALAAHCEQARPDAAPWAAGLFAEQLFYSARMIVHRNLAADLPRPGRDVVIPLSGDQAGTGAAALESGFLAEFGRTRGGLSGAKAKDYLRRMPPTQVIYALVPPPVPPATDLAALRGELPNVQIIAAAGAATAGELPPAVQPLPPLPPAVEGSAWSEYGEAGGSV